MQRIIRSALNDCVQQANEEPPATSVAPVLPHLSKEMRMRLASVQALTLNPGEDYEQDCLHGPRRSAHHT